MFDETRHFVERVKIEKAVEKVIAKKILCSFHQSNNSFTFIVKI